MEETPEWDFADRMRKSLRHASLEVQDIASYLGVSRSSVSNWINGRNRPSRPALRLWAMRCGVSLEWLLGDPKSGNRSFPTAQPSFGLAA